VVGLIVFERERIAVADARDLRRALDLEVDRVVGQRAEGAVGVGLGILWIGGVSLVSSAVQSILLTALYVYASQGTAPPQFDQSLLQTAFASKR
jgi:hypothetical protein